MRLYNQFYPKVLLILNTNVKFLKNISSKYTSILLRCTKKGTWHFFLKRASCIAPRKKFMTQFWISYVRAETQTSSKKWIFIKIALIKAFKYFFLDCQILPLMKGFKTKTLISGHVSSDTFTRFSRKIGSIDPWEIYFL